MKVSANSLWVPFGSFALATLLSFCGGVPRAIARRAPGDTTGKCHCRHNQKANEEESVLLNGHPQDHLPGLNFHWRVLNAAHKGIAKIFAKKKTEKDAFMSVILHSSDGKNALATAELQNGSLGWRKQDTSSTDCCHNLGPSSIWNLRLGWRFSPLKANKAASGSVTFGDESANAPVQADTHYSDDGCGAGIAKGYKLEFFLKVTYRFRPGMGEETTETGRRLDTITDSSIPSGDPRLDPVSTDLGPKSVKTQDSEDTTLSVFIPSGRKFLELTDLMIFQSVPAMEADAADNCAATVGAEFTPKEFQVDDAKEGQNRNLTISEC
jgi:hypothetical protein